jgi:radical SAM superfamily enzyme YgiQ (UPF0313 family)
VPKPRVLLVNPWITDVAAFDLWARPLGLLVWASRLREWGCHVGLIDCTDRGHPSLDGEPVALRPFGTGKYRSERIEPTPEPARRSGRPFRRFGIALDAFDHDLEDFEQTTGGPPDAILVSSRMTYWYQGVIEAIARCRKRWPQDARQMPVLLGGIYATLCPAHAREFSGANMVVEGDGWKTLTELLRERFEIGPSRAASAPPGIEEWPSPALDLCHGHASAPLLTSVGCPFDCAYCASRRLAPRHARRPPEQVLREITEARTRWGTRDFAFYDDALLTDAPNHFEPLLDGVIASRLDVRFHTPNGLHYPDIDGSLAEKMRRAGVETIRLSLESVRPESLGRWNRKGGLESFHRAVEALRAAGYARNQVGVYIMAGMPGQTPDEVRDTISHVLEAGAHPRLNEYSPIPGTREWERALALSGEEIGRDPLWQNNSLYFTREEVFTNDQMGGLKSLARQGRGAVPGKPAAQASDTCSATR